MIIHTHFKKQKPKKPNAKQRELKASWQAILEKYEIKNLEVKSVNTRIPFNTSIPRRSGSNHLPSLDSGLGNTNKPSIPQYTGEACIGIAVQHKSCLQPIFNKQSAEDSAKMRR